MQDVYIVSAVRTPIASFRSSFTSLSVVDLGSIAAKEAIRRAGHFIDTTTTPPSHMTIMGGLEFRHQCRYHRGDHNRCSSHRRLRTERLTTNSPQSGSAGEPKCLHYQQGLL